MQKLLPDQKKSNASNAEPDLKNFFIQYARRELGGMPKYIQLREILLAAIMDGYWKPQEKLPPEIIITQLTPYSLGTVQKALRLLAEEKVVVRRHGIGTFVADNLVSPRHCKFLDDDLATVLPVYPRLISRSLTAGTQPWAKDLDARGENIILLERILDVNNEFMTYNRFHINMHKYPDFWELPKEKLAGKNFKHLLRDRYNIVISTTSSYVRIVDIPDSISKCINVQPNTRGFHLELLARNSMGGNVYFYELFIPPTSRRLHISDVDRFDF